MSYFPLSVYSHYSLLHSPSHLDNIADRLKNIGLPGCALTDHMSMSGSVGFVKACKKVGIKPIIGCTINISEQDAAIHTAENKNYNHLIVLAKNLEGYKELLQLVSEGHSRECFYYEPRLDLERIKKYTKNGNIIGISGFENSVDPDKCKDVFVDKHFYISDNLIFNQSYYCNKNDAIDQKVLLCTLMRTTISNIKHKLEKEDCGRFLSRFFESDKYYIKSKDELDFSIDRATNTLRIADMCETYDIFNQPLLPQFVTPNLTQPDEYLRQLCREGWNNKIKNRVTNEDQYLERIKTELNVLINAGLSSYFLILQDIVRYIKSNGWLCSARGSAYGCLVSYLIGITDVDPIPYGLMFERFYNAGRNTKTRISMPDIDLDVPTNRREEIIEYCINKYGKDKVAQICTFITLKGRSAIKDIFRAYGDISFYEMNQITEHIPDEAKIIDDLQEMGDNASIIQWALENKSEELKQWCYLDKDGKLQGQLAHRFEQAIKLEDTKLAISRHAAGVVISSVPLNTVAPIYLDKDKNPIIGYDMDDSKDCGLTKLDLLGLSALSKLSTISKILSTGGICV